MSNTGAASSTTTSTESASTWAEPVRNLLRGLTGNASSTTTSTESESTWVQPVRNLLHRSLLGSLNGRDPQPTAEPADAHRFPGEGRVLGPVPKAQPSSAARNRNAARSQQQTAADSIGQNAERAIQAMQLAQRGFAMFQQAMEIGQLEHEINHHVDPNQDLCDRATQRRASLDQAVAQSLANRPLDAGSLFAPLHRLQSSRNRPAVLQSHNTQISSTDVADVLETGGQLAGPPQPPLTALDLADTLETGLPQPLPHHNFEVGPWYETTVDGVQFHAPVEPTNFYMVRQYIRELRARHPQARIAILSGTHGSENGITVVEDPYMGEADFFFQDLGHGPVPFSNVFHLQHGQDPGALAQALHDGRYSHVILATCHGAEVIGPEPSPWMLEVWNAISSMQIQHAAIDESPADQPWWTWWTDSCSLQ
ncbi:unnamed protein product [Symbiodinium natans]|uniref:Uncharacterized protein n=1 Tax=Symbiodinium natans TaxID=878477 RepID=A0A812NIY6_9DINO|nr:unnamed protein product [Symbiodinium natans]